MTEGSTSPRERLHRALDFVVDRLGLLPTIVVNLLNVAGGFLLALGGAPVSRTAWTLDIVGVVLLLISVLIIVAIEWWRRQTEAGARQEVAQFSVTVTDILAPLVDKVSQLAFVPMEVRRARLNGIVAHASNSILLLLNTADRPRAVVYSVTEAAKELRLEASCGRSDKPGPFRRGDGGRGDAAFAMIERGDHLFARDVKTSPPLGWKGTGKQYRTFISATITCDDQAYGMITVDSGQPDDLTPADVEIVKLIAALLGTAFGFTYRNRDGLKLSANS